MSSYVEMMPISGWDRARDPKARRINKKNYRQTSKSLSNLRLKNQASMVEMRSRPTIDRNLRCHWRYLATLGKIDDSLKPQ